jgi:hypothetical protein
MRHLAPRLARYPLGWRSHDHAGVARALAVALLAFAVYRFIHAHPVRAALMLAALALVALAALAARARIKDRLAARDDPPGPGLVVGSVRGAWLLARARPFRIPWASFRQHMLVAGPTGRGKTFTFIEPIVRAQCARERTGVFYLDGKGDPLHRPHDGRPPIAFDHVFCPEWPAESAHWNPLSGADPIEAARAFAAALYPQAADHAPNYYEQRAVFALTRVIPAMALTGYGAERPPAPASPQAFAPVTPASLARVVFDPGRLADLTGALEETAQRATAPRHRLLLDQLTHDVGALARVSDRDHAGTLANLQNHLAHFLQPPFLELCSRSDFVVADVCDARRVAFLLPVGRFPVVANALGRIALAQFRNAVLSSAPGVMKIAVLEEFHNFVGPDFGAFLNQARSRDGGAVMAMQGLGDFPPQRRDAMLATIGTLIVTPGAAPQDASYWAQVAGRERAPRASYLYDERPGALDHRRSVRVELVEQYRHTPTEIAELGVGEALIRVTAGRRSWPMTKVRVERD